MKVRTKKQPNDVAQEGGLNVHAMFEVLVPAWGDTVPGGDLEVYIEALGEWKDLRQAFKDHDVITDNYNTRFFEPRNAEDRARGFTL
jgi:hypothetical protein